MPIEKNSNYPEIENEEGYISCGRNISCIEEEKRIDKEIPMPLGTYVNEPEQLSISDPSEILDEPETTPGIDEDRLKEIDLLKSQIDFNKLTEPLTYQDLKGLDSKTKENLVYLINQMWENQGENFAEHEGYNSFKLDKNHIIVLTNEEKNELLNSYSSNDGYSTTTQPLDEPNNDGWWFDNSTIRG